MSLKEHKRLKHGKDVPPDAQLQYLKPGIFAQALVHNKFVFTLPKDVRGDEADLQVLASHAYSSKKFWYVDCKILSPEVPEEEKTIQMPVVRGNTPTTNHKHNLRDLFNRIYQNPTTLADIGITRAPRATSRICVGSSMGHRSRITLLLVAGRRHQGHAAKAGRGAPGCQT